MIHTDDTTPGSLERFLDEQGLTLRLTARPEPWGTRWSATVPGILARIWHYEEWQWRAPGGTGGTKAKAIREIASELSGALIMIPTGRTRWFGLVNEYRTVAAGPLFPEEVPA